MKERRGALGGWRRYTQEQIAGKVGTDRAAKRVLQYCKEITAAGGHPEIEGSRSVGYRVRSGPDDEWESFPPR